jgi:hypothetical protein
LLILLYIFILTKLEGKKKFFFSRSGWRQKWRRTAENAPDASKMAPDGRKRAGRVKNGAGRQKTRRTAENAPDASKMATGGGGRQKMATDGRKMATGGRNRVGRGGDT